LEILTLIYITYTNNPWKLNYIQTINNLPPKIKLCYVDDNIYSNNKNYLDSLNTNIIIHDTNEKAIINNILDKLYYTT
jgi:hypothetical protein